MSPEPTHVELLGVRLDCVGWPQIDQFCSTALEQNKPKQIVTLNGEMVLAATGNGQLKKVINEADLVIPDSTNAVWAARRQGARLAERTPGSDLAIRLAKLAQTKGYSLFLLGATPGVAAEAAAALQKQFPKLKIVGSSAANPDDVTIVKQIASSKADIVLVAYGTPAQDLWISKYKSHLGAKILVGVGGTFDMLSGRLPRAPQLLQSIGLEWLWRLILQPTRLGRVWRSVVVFPLRILLG